MNTRPRTHFAAALVLGTALLLPASSVRAQTASTASAPAGGAEPVKLPASASQPEGDMLTLSPFVVSAEQDTGYEASDTLAGTRLRTPLKDLLAQLDPVEFAQVHRSVVVNLRAISHVTRGANETADVHLKGRPEVLPVSRTYLHLFRQM